MQKHFSYILLIILFISFGLKGQPSIQWQKSFGGTNYENGRVIQQTIDGGYIVAGSSKSNDGNLTVNKGGEDIWIVKIDSIGVIQWQKSFGGTVDEGASFIQQTTDSGYIVVGWSNSNDGDITGNHGDYDFWVVKLDGSGNIQWQKSFGGTGYDEGLCVKQTTDGGYVIAGESNSNNGDVTGNHGDYDYWVVKLNSSGIIQWEKSYGGTQWDYACSIQQTTDGGYIVLGGSRSNNGNVSGHHGLSSSFDYWLVKIDNAGIIQWQKSLGGTLDDQGLSIQQTLDGGYIVAGESTSIDGDVSGNHSNADYWIVKLDVTGNIQWEKSLGGTGNDFAESVYQTNDLGYVIIGSSESNDGNVSCNHGDRDCWVVKLDNLGNLQWQKSFGGFNGNGAGELGASIQETTDGGFVFAGTSGSNNGDVTGNHGDYDYWVVKLFCNPPIANFTLNGNQICVGDTLSFTNTTTTYNDLEWFNNGVPFSNNTNPYLTLNNPGVYSISLVAATENCSSHNNPYTDTAYSTLLVNALPNSSFTGLNSSYCLNDIPLSLIASSSGGVFSGNGISSNLFSPSFAGIGLHTIFYTIIDTNGCTSTSNQSVIVNQLPNLSFTTLLPNYCSNYSSINLIGSPIGGVFSGSGISGNIFNPSFTTIGIDSISYIYSDTNGCSNFNFQIVTINPVPTVNFSGLTANYCINSNPINLTGTPAGGTFSGNGISGNVFDPSIAGTGNSDVLYTYTDGNSCTNVDTQQVIINSLPIVNYSGLSTNYCITSVTSNLTGVPSGGVFIGNGISGNLFNPSSASIGTNNITYNYTDINGCSNSTSQTTNIVPLPIANISGVSSICQGETINLAVSGIGIFLWNTGDTSTFLTETPAITTTYFVTASNFCGNSVDSILINVNPLPIVTLSNDTTILLGNSANISATGGTTYLWNPSSGLSCTNCPNPIVTPQSSTTYSVTITGTNGCSTTKTVTIYLNDDFEIFVPDIFSPNGDGQNDILYVRGTGIKELNFVIYDRLGEKIFESNDLTKGWDGTFKGSPLNSSVFLYYLSATLYNDKKIKTKGDITLIR